MDSPEAVNGVVPETATEAALANGVEEIVAAIVRPKMRTRHSIASVMQAYEFMRQHGSHTTPQETQVVLALASEFGGLITWIEKNGIVGLATFWPTNNPNVQRMRAIPSVDREGQYIYFDWCFGMSLWREWRRAVAYAVSVYSDATFVCCHDYRRRVKGNKARGSGRLLVRGLDRVEVPLTRLLGL